MMHSVGDYVSALKNDELLGYHCDSCNREWLTTLNFCPFCGSSRVVEAKLPKGGKVLAFTFQNVVPEHLQSKAPYAIGVIALSNESRIQARIDNYDASMGNIIGKEVTMVHGDESGLVFRLV